MYQDLGTKSPCSTGGCEASVPSKSEEPRINYPYLNLNTAEAIDATADEVIECKVKLRFKGFDKSDYNKDQPFSNRFDVIAIDFGDSGIDVEDDPAPDDSEGLQKSLEKQLGKKFDKNKKAAAEAEAE